MYVRWQARKRLKPAYGHWGKQVQADFLYQRRYGYTRAGTDQLDVHWTAQLVQSVRINGKPRQHHIAQLGGITESAMQIIAQRCYFWDHIDARLDGLGNQITPADRKKIETAIAEKVTRPTSDEYKEVARWVAKNMGWKYLTEEQRAALADEAEQWQERASEE